MSVYSNPVYLTRAKFAAYEQQLKYMEGKGSEKLSKLLASAPGSGMGRPLDLPIHDLARRFYAEIDDIKSKLNRAQIIDDYVQNISDRSVIDIGARVMFIDLEVNEIDVYTILGPDEADPRNGRISFLSPIGSALIGKRSGDIVAVESTGGRFKIKDVTYEPFDFVYDSSNWDYILDHTLV